MSTIYKCDKCGREIESSRIVSLTRRKFNGLARDSFDLCEACAIDFEAWLMSPLSFAGALHACGADKDKDKGES